MPGCKPNNRRYLWYPFSLHDGGPGLRLNDSFHVDIKLSSVGWCLMLDIDRANRCSTCGCFFVVIHCVSTGIHASKALLGEQKLGRICGISKCTLSPPPPTHTHHGRFALKLILLSGDKYHMSSPLLLLSKLMFTNIFLSVQWKMQFLRLQSTVLENKTVGMTILNR